MTFVEFLNAFKIWGPLGILAALSTWGCVHLYRNGRADAKNHAAESKALAISHAGDLVAAAKGYAAEIAERDKNAAASLAAQAELHHGQMTELTDRFVTLHEKSATENRELTQQVRSLIEVVSRKRR